MLRELTVLGVQGFRVLGLPGVEVGARTDSFKGFEVPGLGFRALKS